jgi:hypothetical protein
MLTFHRRVVALGAVLSAALLVACGGGGSTTTTLSYDTDRIQVTAFHGQAADVNASQDASVTINVTASDPPSGNTYIAVRDSASGFGGRAIEVLQQSDTQFQVTLYPQTSLAPGVHQGTLTVVLCKNVACSSHYPVENASLPYEVTIAPQLLADVTVDGIAVYTLNSDRDSNTASVEAVGTEMVVEFTSSIPTSVHHSSGSGMLQVEIDPTSTNTYWKLRVTKPQLYYGGGLGISLWPEDDSKFNQHAVTLHVDLLNPPE